MARRTMALALAVVLAGTAPAHAAPDSTAPAARGQASSERKTVTLVTGDRVVLAGDRLVSITPGKHRQNVSFQVTRHAGRLRVVPTDVTRALAEGRVDQRLFDVTGLVEAGYDDARRDTVPVIVSGRPPSGARVADALPAVDAVTAEVPKATGWLDLPEGTGKVWLDGMARPLLDRSTTQVGAPVAWAAGLTGAGVTVGVVDTGVEGDHPDLVGKEVAGRDFTDEQDGVDRYGHGTHVASTIAGHRAPYRGVAPDARLLDAKVCDSKGFCPESAIIEGMRWAAEQGADVVNISLGLVPSDDVDPVEAAVDALSASHGTLFVVSAGNSGDDAGTVLSPGTADSALTVGAVDRDDSLAQFSSRGPRVADGAVKPDITAPGVDIVAARPSTGELLGTPVGEHHMALSGTSMASPHVAGAAALLAQRHPDWNGARLKAALTASARPNPALNVHEQGSGRLDIAEALATTVTSEPTSVVLGRHEWPHDDDTPTTKPLVYRNDGTQPVTLDLAVQASGPVFSVSPARVTVPAGGTAADGVLVSLHHPGGFPAGTRVGHAGPALPAGQLEVFVSAQYASPAASYWLGWVERGRVPDGFVRRPRESDLAKVRTTIALKHLGGPRDLAGHVVTPSGTAGPLFFTDVTATPTSTRYLTPGVDWQTLFFDEGALMNGKQERYGAGRTYDRSFGAPVIGPVMYSGSYPNLTRTGDEVAVSLSLFGDRDGNEGYSRTTAARTALYRDGKLVGENDSSGHGVFAVPPGPAVFRARTEVTRAPEDSDFSTRIEVDWTFRSDTTTREQRLPMSVVRFTPELDHTGSTPAYRPLTVPLVVDQQRGVDNPPLRNFRVEVSYDDGASWTSLPVFGRAALVGNRAKPGTFASLRVHADDGRDRKLSQTVIRAYRLG